jgi:hypothetical protein
MTTTDTAPTAAVIITAIAYSPRPGSAAGGVKNAETQKLSVPSMCQDSEKVTVSAALAEREKRTDRDRRAEWREVDGANGADGATVAETEKVQRGVF